MDQAVTPMVEHDTSRSGVERAYRSSTNSSVMRRLRGLHEMHSARGTASNTVNRNRKVRGRELHLGKQAMRNAQAVNNSVTWREAKVKTVGANLKVNADLRSGRTSIIEN